MKDKIDKNYQFLLEYFTDDKIFVRYRNLLTQVVDIINEIGVADQVEINEELLMQSVLDYFTDIARLKQFHNIDSTNEQKTYAYGTYWFLRRSPIQITSPVSDIYTHINEKVAVAMMLPKMLKEVGADVADDSDRIKSLIKEYMALLYYNFRYRQYNPHSLELMIAAFFCGCICFHEGKSNDAG